MNYYYGEKWALTPKCWNSSESLSISLVRGGNGAAPLIDFSRISFSLSIFFSI